MEQQQQPRPSNHKAKRKRIYLGDLDGPHMTEYGFALPTVIVDRLRQAGARNGKSTLGQLVTDAIIFYLQKSAEYTGELMRARGITNHQPPTPSVRPSDTPPPPPDDSRAGSD